MKVRSRWTWVCATAVLGLMLSACGGGRTSTPTTAVGGAGGTPAQVTPDPGITDAEILVGSSYAFSGNASFYGTISKTTQAYFKYINEEKGGVKMGDGKTRQIKYKVLDDGYTPARMVENVKQLVEQDKVFLIFNTLGTPTNSAIWDYMQEQKVPQLFVATGATKWGDYKDHPWTIGYQPTYQAESAVYVEFLKKEKPNATVAILYQNDDYGKDYLTGFENAIKGTQIKILAKESYESADPTVDSQVTKLSDSKADVFFNVTTPKFAAQAIKKIAEIGTWKPIQLLNGVSSSKASVLTPAGLDNSKNIYSTIYAKDPTDPQWDTDKGMMDYKRLLVKYDASLNPADSLNTFGWGVTEAFIKVLEATKAPTRQAIMDAARNLKDYEGSLALPGVKVQTTPTDPYPLEALALVQFDGITWKLQGSVIDVSKK